LQLQVSLMSTTTSTPGLHCSKRGRSMGSQGPGALRTRSGRQDTAKQRPQMEA
jgi:hypothetical protein